MDRITIEGDRPFGPGAKATESEIRRRKVPSVLDFKDRRNGSSSAADKRSIATETLFAGSHAGPCELRAPGDCDQPFQLIATGRSD